MFIDTSLNPGLKMQCVGVSRGRGNWLGENCLLKALFERGNFPVLEFSHDIKLF